MIIKKTAVALSLTITLFAGSTFADHYEREHHEDPYHAHLDHVFLIMMENHSYEQIIGNPNAPFINKMTKITNLATNFSAIGHPSLTNYLEVVGGSNFGVISDHSPDWHNETCIPNLVSGVPSKESSPNAICPIAGIGMDAPTPAVDTNNEGTLSRPVYNTPFPAARTIGRTIADQLTDAGMSWKSYQEDLPAAGADQVNYSDGIFSNLSPVKQSNIQKLYAVKHNPFAYFANVQGNVDPTNGLANMVGFGGIKGLYSDLRAGKMPNFSFIAPNQCHDMHGTSNSGALCAYEPNPTLIQMGDATVQELVTEITKSDAWSNGKNAIVVLWDENDFSSLPNKVVAIVETNYGAMGIQSGKPYNHFSLLKTLEIGFGLKCLNHACDENVEAMFDLFGL